MSIDSLLSEAEGRTRQLLQAAEAEYAVRCRLNGIYFDLKGKNAGMVVFPPGRSPYIRYNPSLLRRNRDAFLSQTLPHEVAHLVARTLYGAKIRPHGQEWQAIMQFFGVEPRRCHDFDLDEAQVRKMQNFPYRCGCRQHQLTAIRHNRIRKGLTYRCRFCGESLSPVES